MCLLLLCVAASALAQTAPASKDLLANPGLEDRGDGDVPPHWKAVTVWGAPASFAIDAKERHGGGQSFRIASQRSTQSFLRGDPIEVAPGETIRASAWVKVKDIVAKDGDAGIVLTAEMLNGDGREEQFARFAKVTDAKGGAWQRIEGTVKIPPLAATLRLRLAFVDCAGVAWFDDATLEAAAPLVARIDLPHELLSPDRGGLPVLLINRDARHDEILVHGRLGDSDADVTVNLSGATTQPCIVPVSMTTRGRFVAETWLADAIVEKRQLTVPPPLVLDPPIPTHWTADEGRSGGPTVRPFIALTASDRAQATLDLQLQDEKGGTIGAAQNLPAARADAQPQSLAIFRSLLPGKYRFVATLNVPGKPPITAQQPWTVLAHQPRVTVGNDGFLRIGQTAIFPLGVFNGSGRMKELGEAGFTIAHTYNSVEGEIGGRLDHVEAQGYLDAAQAAGMKALMLIPRRPLFAGDMETVRERIRMFRNHPALLAWDEEEGIARGDMTPQRLAALRKLIAEEDPNHPLMVGDSRDVITNVTDRANFFPADSMDLGMWWWYPIPPLGEKGGALGGDEITAGAELVPPAFLTLSKLKQPLWVGVQSYKKPQSYGRFPTPAEYRAQAYLALIHGAKGLMWYGGSVEGGIFLEPQEGHWNELKSLVRELYERAPLFASATDQPPKIEPADTPISVVLKRQGRTCVLIAVNRSDRPIDAAFVFPEAFGGAPQILGETRSATVRTGRLMDHFAPYGIHLYQWQ